MFRNIRSNVSCKENYYKPKISLELKQMFKTIGLRNKNITIEVSNNYPKCLLIQKFIVKLTPKTNWTPGPVIEKLRVYKSV